MQMSLINESLLTSKVPWAKLQNTATGPGLRFSDVAVFHHRKGTLSLYPLTEADTGGQRDHGTYPRSHSQQVAGHEAGHLLLETR